MYSHSSHLFHLFSCTVSHFLTCTFKCGIQLLQNVRLNFLEFFAQPNKGFLGLRSDSLEVLHELSGRV